MNSLKPSKYLNSSDLTFARPPTLTTCRVGNRRARGISSLAPFQGRVTLRFAAGYPHWIKPPKNFHDSILVSYRRYPKRRRHPRFHPPQVPISASACQHISAHSITRFASPTQPRKTFSNIAHCIINNSKVPNLSQPVTYMALSARLSLPMPSIYSQRWLSSPTVLTTDII